MGSNGKLSNRPEQGRKQKQPWPIKFSRRDSQNVVDPTEKEKKIHFGTKNYYKSKIAN